MHDEILKAILDTATSTNQKVDRIEDQLTRLETRLESHEEQLEHLNRVVLWGNGKPALIAQIEQVHHTRETVASVEARLNHEIGLLNTKIDSKKEMLWAIVIVLLGGNGGQLVVCGQEMKIYILMRGENPLYAAHLKEDLERMRNKEPTFFSNTHIVEVPMIFPQSKSNLLFLDPQSRRFAMLTLTLSQRFRLNCEAEAVALGHPPQLGQIYCDILNVVANGQAVPEALRMPLIGWLGLYYPQMPKEELELTNNEMIDACVDVFSRLKSQ